MKKIISLCLFGATFMPLANAANVTTYNYGATETETAAASDATDKDVAASKAAMRGWFVGLGLAQGGYKTTADDLGHTYRYSDSTGFDVINSPDFKERDVAGSFASAGLPGIIVSGSVTKNGNNALSATFIGNGSAAVFQNKLNKLGALLIAGWGDFDGNLYYGAQIALDISGNKDTELSKDSFGTVKLESKGFRPYFEVMLGRYFETIDALFYLKGGVTYSRAKLLSDKGDVKVGSFAPLIGVGAKKAVTENMTVCTEVGYVFEVNKKGSLNTVENYTIVNGSGANVSASTSHEMDTKVRNRGYNIRVFATYNF